MNEKNSMIISFIKEYKCLIRGSFMITCEILNRNYKDFHKDLID